MSEFIFALFANVNVSEIKAVPTFILPWNILDSSSDGNLNWSTYTHCALGNPKTEQTFSP